jgi:hypothetical protein
MSFSFLSELNWLAVIVAGIVYFAVGAVWFAPGVFGKWWMRSIGLDPSQQPPQASPTVYIAPFIGHIIVAMAVGLLAAATGTDALGEGIVLGIVVGLGVAAAVLFDTYYFDPKATNKMLLFAISGGYQFLGVLIISVIVAVWQ